MTYGFRITNNSGELLVDDATEVYAVSTVFSATAEVTRGFSDSRKITVPGSLCYFDGSFYALRWAGDANNSLSLSYASLLGFGILTKDISSGSGTIVVPAKDGAFEVAVVRKLSNTSPYDSNNYGLLVRNDSGQTVFSSAHRYFRVTHIFTFNVNASTPAHAVTYNFPALPQSRPLYVLWDTALKLKSGGDTVTLYIKSISMNSTSATVTLGRSVVYNNSMEWKHQPGAMSIRVGYIV